MIEDLIVVEHIIGQQDGLMDHHIVDQEEVIMLIVVFHLHVHTQDVMVVGDVGDLIMEIGLLKLFQEIIPIIEVIQV